MNTTEQQETIKELQKGICELTIVDNHSVEHIISATLSLNHLPDVDGELNFTPDKYNIMLWNMVKEEWQTYPVNYIIDLERLTGFGVKDNLLQPSEDYINSIGNIMNEEE